jgi:hypothetical protein
MCALLSLGNCPIGGGGEEHMGSGLVWQIAGLEATASGQLPKKS